MALSFPPIEWSGWIWIALVPWLVAVERSPSLRAAIAQGFWLNLILGFTNAFSVAYAVPRYLDVSIVGGVAALFAYALVHQLALAIFAGCAWALRRSPRRGGFVWLLGGAALYTGIDWALPKVFPITLGHAIHDIDSLRQIVALGGESALTLLVLWVNLALFAGASARLRGVDGAVPLSLYRLAWIVAPIVAALAYGEARLLGLRDAERAAATTLRIGMVQGNVEEQVRERWSDGDPVAARESLDVYVREMTALLRAGDAPDLVVWPETSYPGVFRKPENDGQLVLNGDFDRFVAAAGTPVAFGGYDRDEDAPGRVLRNALFLVTPRAGQGARELSPVQVYHKSILLPVGEYLPFIDAEVSRRWLPGSANLAPGEAAHTVELARPGHPALRLGPMICYEDLFASHAVSLAEEGADLLVTISNDGWFGDFGAARLHWIMARMRSVETAIPQVRVTNSGYSALFMPDGDARYVTEFGRRVAQTVDVPLSEIEPTLRTRWGDWLGPTCLLLGAIGWLVERRRAAIRPAADAARGSGSPQEGPQSRNRE